MFQRVLAAGLAATLLGSACAPAATPTTAPASSGEVVVYSGRSEALIKPIVELFQAQYPNIQVTLKVGSNSELANALLEERNNPQADVFITTELMTLQRMANEGVFQAYQSPNAANVPADYRHPEWLWTALTLRSRVIMYNTDLVSPDEVPQSMFDLTDPKWKGQIAAAGSTNGGFQAQVAAMRQLVGEAKTEAWLAGLQANEVTFFGGHTDVRKAVGAGEFKLGLVNHYYYHLQVAETGKVGVVYPDQAEGQMGLLVNATGIGIVNGASHVEAARTFVDFMLSQAGESAFAERNYEYPVRADGTLRPEVAPLSGFRLAQFNTAAAANTLDATLDLLEKIGIP